MKTSRPYRTGETPVWTETKFDALGRPTEAILPDGNKTTYVYSVENNANWIGTLTLVTGPAGKQKRYLRDASGLLIRVDEPDTSGTLTETARYAYDVMGRTTTVQMGKRPDETFKQTRTFAYNTKGQLTSATNPENGTISYTHFADGLPESKTDAKGQTLWSVFDDKHRLLRVESPQGTTKTSFAYGGGSNSAGRMSLASNDGYTWYFDYDVMGRVTTQTLEAPNPSDPGYPLRSKAVYAYDGDGRLQDLYYPATMVAYGPIPTGGRHQYSYDLLGRPLDLKLDSGDPLVKEAQYNAAGQLTQWKEYHVAGLYNTLTRSYDPLRGWINQITAQKTWPGSETVLNLTYSYLANGRVSAVTDAVNPGQSVSSYEYDQLNRLTKATATNWALEWSYDEFGNRLSQTKVPGSSGTPPEISLSYGESTNRITTAGYSYDLNGNLTAMPGVSNIGYDVFDRIASITKSGSTSTAKYDAFGRRIARVMADGTTPVYFYDMGGRLLTGGGSGLIRYFAGHRLGHYTDRTGTVRYKLAGTINSHYYPFGEEITSTAGDTYKFAQLYRDADTGLDYAMARYHSSTIGRFLSVDRGGIDPANPQLWNRYAYSFNDPINYGDPSGLDPCSFGGDFCITVIGSAFEPIIPLYRGGDPFFSFFEDFLEGLAQISPPQPLRTPTPLERAETRLTEGKIRLRIAMSVTRSECSETLAALGVTRERIIEAVNNVVILNGIGSSVTMISLFPKDSSPYLLQENIDNDLGHPQTVNELFAGGNVKALAELNGPRVFIRPGHVSGLSPNQAGGLIMHEVLHNLGLTDGQIKSNLWLPGLGTKVINDKLLADCF